MKNQYPQDNQESAATGCQYTCQSFLGYSAGLLLGIPPLVLASLGRSSASCLPNTHAYLFEVGIVVYLIELGIILLLILGSFFWRKTARFLTFALGLGLLTMLIPFCLTELGGLQDGLTHAFQCSHLSVP